MDNVSNFDSGSEREVYIEALGNLKEKKLIFGTKTGMLKVVAGSEFIVGKRTTAATKLAEGDELLTVAPLEEGGNPGNADGWKCLFAHRCRHHTGKRRKELSACGESASRQAICWRRFMCCIKG